MFFLLLLRIILILFYWWFLIIFKILFMIFGKEFRVTKKVKNGNDEYCGEGLNKNHCSNEWRRVIKFDLTFKAEGIVDDPKDVRNYK